MHTHQMLTLSFKRVAKRQILQLLPYVTTGHLSHHCTKRLQIQFLEISHSQHAHSVKVSKMFRLITFCQMMFTKDVLRLSDQITIQSTHTKKMILPFMHIHNQIYSNDFLIYTIHNVCL